MMRCSERAFAMCPTRHLCGTIHEATFTDDSECAEFNRKVEYMPMTNADRIRDMTDNELAEFLADKYVMESCLRLKDQGYEPTETQKKVIKHTLYCTWMNWLRQPVEEQRWKNLND